MARLVQPVAYRHNRNDQKTCARKVRAEAQAFTEARKFQVKERIVDDLVVDRVDFVQYRVARGDSVFAANGKFDNLHLEQGEEEDSTDVERVTLPGAVRKNRRRTGAESSRGVVQKNGVTDEAFQTRRRQLKREASATDDESAGGNVTVPSSVDGNAAQCPGTLAVPSATSSLSSNRVDLPCSMSQGRRAAASGAKQAAPCDCES